MPKAPRPTAERRPVQNRVPPSLRLRLANSFFFFFCILYNLPTRRSENLHPDLWLEFLPRVSLCLLFSSVSARSLATKNLFLHSSNQKAGHLSLQHVQRGISRAHPLVFPMPNNDASKQQIRRRPVDAQRSGIKLTYSRYCFLCQQREAWRDWKYNREKFAASSLFFRHDAPFDFFLTSVEHASH